MVVDRSAGENFAETVDIDIKFGNDDEQNQLYSVI